MIGLKNPYEPPAQDLTLPGHAARKAVWQGWVLVGLLMFQLFEGVSSLAESIRDGLDWVVLSIQLGIQVALPAAAIGCEIRQSPAGFPLALLSGLLFQSLRESTLGSLLVFGATLGFAFWIARLRSSSLSDPAG